nr:hypothetical protein [Tanacetum cinerariifolium]
MHLSKFHDAPPPLNSLCSLTIVNASTKYCWNRRPPRNSVVPCSDRLRDKIKIVFTRTHSKDECFIGIVRDLCYGLRLTLSKNRRLIAELEPLGHCVDAVRSLGYLREMVGRDSETLGVLEQLLDRAKVGRHWKAGYADDIDETE